MSGLSQLRMLDVKINQKIGELNGLREKATALESFDYSRDKVQVSPKASGPYVDLVGKMVDLDAEISADVETFILKRHDIINEIQGMDDPRYIEVLYKRYVEYKSFEVIAQEMNYACEYVRALHGKAVKVFESSYKILHTDMV